MDWKRLVQFALLGSSDLEQYAILLVRVSIGLFFAISGANKLFVAGGRFGGKAAAKEFTELRGMTIQTSRQHSPF